MIGPLDGSGDVLSGLLGATFGLMTPAPLDIATHPRLFVDLSVLPTLTQETAIARSGDPGEYGIRLPIARASPFVGERLVAGTGTQITSQHQGVQLHIALGSAFTFDFGEHRLRIKPSIQYSRTENKISVEARRAVRIVNADPIDPITPSNGRIRSLASYRFVTLADDFTEVFHGLGPALEIEYDTENRVGPFVVSVFLKGAASHLFGDLETEFVAANPDFPSETVRFKYKNDPWTYQATTGIRLRLVPVSK